MSWYIKISLKAHELEPWQGRKEEERKQKGK
jgi:hypothetical protein